MPCRFSERRTIFLQTHRRTLRNYQLCWPFEHPARDCRGNALCPAHDARTLWKDSLSGEDYRYIELKTQPSNPLSSFNGRWNARFAEYAKNQNCHFNLHQEFTSIYTMEVNRGLIALLRLTEIDDLLRQLAHFSRENLVSFADPPGFLTTELKIKLSSVSALANAVDAPKDGFPLIIEPLVDYQLSTSRNLQLHLLFILPTLKAKQAICTIGWLQLVPLSYQINGKCFGGSLTRHDLVLLTCDNTRYVLKLFFVLPRRCPLWLGLKRTPQIRLTFNHAYSFLPNCNNLRPLIHLSRRYYCPPLSTTYPFKLTIAIQWHRLPTVTTFSRVPAVRQNNWLQHQGITKAQREHGFRLL